jgi:dCMP deaminase
MSFDWDFMASSTENRMLTLENENQKKWDFRFLELAKLVGSWSKDPGLKCGAVLVRPNRSVASVGFNGFPQGMLDDSALYNDRPSKLDRMVHSEINCQIFAYGSVEGCTLYGWPIAPCHRCCVQMVQAGVKRFVWPTPNGEQLNRWGDSLELTKRYLAEVRGICYTEWNYPNGI